MTWSREIAGRRSSRSPEEVTSQRTQELLSAQRFAVPCLHPWPGLCHRNAKSPCAGGTHSFSHGLSREVSHLASPLRLPPSYTYICSSTLLDSLAFFQRTASWPPLLAAFWSPGGHKTAEGCLVSWPPAPKWILLLFRAAPFALMPGPLTCCLW